MTETTTPETAADISSAAIVERVVIEGDLRALKPHERVAYYARVCESLGLNPLTRPFEYLVLNNRMILYARRDATDQIRRNVGVSITRLEYPAAPEGLFTVVAYGRDRLGREDSSSGIVATRGLSGDHLANAMIKAETKAKRRLTLSLAGLGLPDESEVADIPDALPARVDEQGNVIDEPRTVAGLVAERVAALVPSDAPAPEIRPETPETPEADPAPEYYAPPRETSPEDPARDPAEVPGLAYPAFVEEAKKRDRVQLRQLAAEMFPDVLKFADLTDAERAALIAESDARDQALADALAARVIPEEAADETEIAAAVDAPAPVLTAPITEEESASEVGICASPSPYGDGAVCTLPPRHSGSHKAGETVSW